MDKFREHLESKLKEIKPLNVFIKRGKTTESIHRVHAAICDSKGRLLKSCGDSCYQTFIRSGLKPFQVLPFLTSGTYEAFNSDAKAIALACGSHIGDAIHAREAFKLLWNASIDIDNLKCPTPSNKTSSLQHNCSGKHSAFLATCKKMNWDLKSYLDSNHPLQQEILRKISEILGIPSEEFVSEKDDCGSPNYLMTLSQMSILYATLCNSVNAEYEKIVRAMTSFPELIAGNGSFDTELIKRGHSQVISKGGAEGIQCIGRVGKGIGLALKVEDGSKRAKHAAAIYILRELEWMTPTALDELSEVVLNLRPNVSIEIHRDVKIP